ncbi:MAG: WD40 repeat domain-containing protein [Pirellulaceae bacterium]
MMIKSLGIRTDPEQPAENLQYWANTGLFYYDRFDRLAQAGPIAIASLPSDDDFWAIGFDASVLRWPMTSTSPAHQWKPNQTVSLKSGYVNDAGDGALLLCQRVDGKTQLRYLDWSEDQPRDEVLPISEPIERFACSDDLRVVATINQQTGKVSLFKDQQWADPTTLEPSQVQSIVVATDGAFLCTSGGQGTVLWTPEGEIAGQVEQAGILNLSRSGNRLAIRTDTDIHLVDISKRNQDDVLQFSFQKDSIKSLRQSSMPVCLAMNGDGRFLALGRNAHIELIDLANKLQVARLEPSNMSVLSSLAFSPDDSHLVAGGVNGRASAFEMRYLRTLKRRELWKTSNGDVSLQADGTWVERSDDRRFVFQERIRTVNHVELYDPKRDLSDTIVKFGRWRF